MRKISLVAICLLGVALALCGCNNFPMQSRPTSPQCLSEEEARIALIDFAEPKLAEAVKLPTWAFEMTNYRIDVATHYAESGYWDFEVSGKIPMYDDGLWYIKYEFDAKVDDTSGKVTLGELSLKYG